MYFHGGEEIEHSFASTRDVDLHREEGRSYWEEDFENPLSGCVLLLPADTIGIHANGVLL